MFPGDQALSGDSTASYNISNSTARKYNLVIAVFVDVRKEHDGRRDIAPLILNLANRRKWFVNFTLQPYNPPGENPLPTE